MPDGMFEHGNWTMENVYWNLYGATGIGGRAIMPYVLNFFACFYGYLFAAFLVTLSAAQLAEFYAYVFAAAALPASYLSHFIMSDALGNLALGQAEESAEWFVHRHLSTWDAIQSTFRILGPNLGQVLEQLQYNGTTSLDLSHNSKHDLGRYRFWGRFTDKINVY